MPSPLPNTPASRTSTHPTCRGPVWDWTTDTPTPHLLDISRDVTTALWFASSDNPDEIGVVAAFDETGIGHLTAIAAKSMEFHELMDALQYPETISTKPAVGWIPRSLTSRILAQRGLFILSSYADQPWGSVHVTGTYVWQGDIDENYVEPSEPRAFFVAIRPELKKEVSRPVVLGFSASTLRRCFPISSASRPRTAVRKMYRWPRGL